MSRRPGARAVANTARCAKCALLLPIHEVRWEQLRHEEELARRLAGTLDRVDQGYYHAHCRPPVRSRVP